MRDAFIAVMCLLLAVDCYQRLVDRTTDVGTYWTSLGFNVFLLVAGIAAFFSTTPPATS